MSATTQINTPNDPTTKQSSCCERISHAFGRCWQWIVDCWHWFIDKVFCTVDAVAFGFFRVVEWFSPNLALRLEGGYGYLSKWYLRHTAAVQAKALQTQIEGLEDVNRGLNQRVQEIATQSAHLQVANHQLAEERDRLKTERHTDIHARIEAAGQRDLIQKTNQRMNERNISLQNEISRLQAELEKTTSKTTSDAEEKERLIDERNNLTRSIKLLQMQKQHAERERDISYNALQLIGRISPNSSKEAS